MPKDTSLGDPVPEDPDPTVPSPTAPGPHPAPPIGRGLVLGAVLTLARFVVPWFESTFEGYRIAFFAGLLGPLVLGCWWLFWSRTPRAERLGVALVGIASLGLVWQLNHDSLGVLWLLGNGLPLLALALSVWVLTGRWLTHRHRWPALVAILALALGGWPLVRMEGFNGAHQAQYRWRWEPTQEDQFLAGELDRASTPTALSPLTRPPVQAEETSTDDWSEFRGPRRDGVVHGTRIATDWSATPPVALWRRPIGPGWSSFAVRGALVYTQEQRGEEELVTAYALATGEPVWQHRNPVRFYDAISGAGPRATPTLGGERLFTFGATGILDALDPADGTLLWSRDVASEMEASLPWWGFSASPLLVEDRVVVAVGGRLVAYDQATGDPLWSGTSGGDTYSSPHLVTLDGVDQVVLLDGAGAVAVDPVDGTVLWQNPWKGQPLVQPALTPDGDLLTSSGEGRGLRRLAIAQGADGWTVEERWTSHRFKPNFNDFVVHQGHLYGFDGALLACLGLDDGERRWKGGRYGQGQLLLLADQGLLLVLSERGELALVAANPEGFTELARIPAIEGKTWNHPAPVGDVLLVRNGQEMAAFRLPLEGPGSSEPPP